MWPTENDTQPEEAIEHQLLAAEAPTPMDHIQNLDINQPPEYLRLTGIAVTVGKTTYDVKIMEKLLASGMNIAILNMIFGTREEHVEAIKMLRTAAKNYGVRIGTYCPLAIAVRLSGRSIRTGRIAQMFGDSVELKHGEYVKLTTDETYKERCSMLNVYVDLQNFPQQMNKHDEIYLDNELILLRVEAVFGSVVTCKVERGGALGSDKNVYVANKKMIMPNFSEQDELDIEMAVRHQVDMIIILFVTSASIIEDLRKILGPKGKKIAIVANVQTYEAYKNFDEILSATNGIMITRQELGDDILPEKLVLAQKHMIARANQANVPILVSAYVLSTMRNKEIALRSEILDVSNLVLDGADTFVLSSETAVGAHPVKAVISLHEACKEAEACAWTKQLFRDYLEKTVIPCDQITCTAVSAALAAQKCTASAIVVVSPTGRCAKIISKYKPRCPIIVVTKYYSTAKQLHMWRGILPLLYDAAPASYWMDELDLRVKYCTKWGLGVGFIKVGDNVVVVTGWHPKLDNSNTMRVIRAS